MADETLNRVARMIYEGATVQNLHSYLFGAARHLASERRKEQRQAQAAIAQLAEVAQSRPADDDTSQQSCLDCCEACLANLPEQSRALIMAYYALEKRAKIDHHKRVAEELGVSLNSLRIRAHRIKLKLENCIVECEAKRGQK